MLPNAEAPRKRRLINISAMAEKYGCSVHEIRRRHRLGLIPAGIRPGGRRLYWDEAVADADIDAKQQHGVAA